MIAADSLFPTGKPRVAGRLQPAYARLAELLADEVTVDRHYGAQVAAYRFGEPLFDLVAGARAQRDSVTGVASVGKGVAAICVALLVQDGLLDLDEPVVHYWAEFGANGKGSVTVRQLLSHQCGIVGLPGGLNTLELSSPASMGVAARLANATPAWFPGSLHGYHAVTIGYLTEELFFRAAGISIQEFYDSRIREVLDIATYLGVPKAVNPRYVPVLDRIVTKEDQASIAEGPDVRDQLRYEAYNANGPPSPNGIPGELSPNIPSIRAHGNPAFACVSDAAGLAKLYGATLAPVGNRRILSRETVAIVSQTQVAGFDQVTLDETAFGILFMKSCPDFSYGSASAFGHYGALGAFAYADPALDLAVAYVPYHASRHPGGPDHRAMAVNARIRSIAREGN